MSCPDNKGKGWLFSKQRVFFTEIVILTLFIFWANENIPEKILTLCTAP